MATGFSTATRAGEYPAVDSLDIDLPLAEIYIEAAP
jgi:hypothetical protein